MRILHSMAGLIKYIRFKLYVIEQNLTSKLFTITENLQNQKFIWWFAEIFLSKLPYYSDLYVNTLFAQDIVGSHSSLIRSYISNKYKYIQSPRDLKLAMRHALLLPDVDLADDIIGSVGNSDKYNIMFASKRFDLVRGNFSAYLKSFRHSPKKKIIKKYFLEKYVEIDDIENILRSNNKISILTTLGPGDELLFSYIYTGIIEDSSVENSNLSIVCDHRFTEIFKRSFPELAFIPSRRKRYIQYESDLKHFNKLPSFKLHKLLCNQSMSEIVKSNKFIFNLDILETYSHLLGQKKCRHRILPNQEKVLKYKERLDPHKSYIGLCWRSGTLTGFRNHNYFSIEQISKIFELEHLTFINLQYDDSSKEQAWVDEKFPGKLITFPDIDMYNDFDSVISLMDCLDAVITPATAVCDLSANLRQKTILLSNVAEVANRKNNKGIDLFHPNLVHISGEKLGDKKSLVQNLYQYLKDNF